MALRRLDRQDYRARFGGGMHLQIEADLHRGAPN